MSLSGVTVQDDHLGLVAGPFDLAPGEKRVFTRTEEIHHTTVNWAIVTGYGPEGRVCTADATAEVVVEAPCGECASAGEAFS